MTWRYYRRHIFVILLHLLAKSTCKTKEAEAKKIRGWMTEASRLFFLPLFIHTHTHTHTSFFLSPPPLSVSLSGVCRRNTLLYLHPNDPSSGPWGWALCITQRSIRARAWRLLCPIRSTRPTHFLTVAFLSFLPHVSFIRSQPPHIHRLSITSGCANAGGGLLYEANPWSPTSGAQKALLCAALAWWKMNRRLATVFEYTTSFSAEQKVM